MSDVPRSLQSWVSTIQTVVLTADVFQLLIKKLQSLLLSRMNEPYLKKNWKTSAVSTTVWMVETQLCKLRGTCNTNNLSCSRTPGCRVSGLRTNIKHRIMSLDININTSTRTVTCQVLLRIPLTRQVQRRNSTYVSRNVNPAIPGTRAAHVF